MALKQLWHRQQFYFSFRFGGSLEANALMKAAEGCLNTLSLPFPRNQAPFRYHYSFRSYEQNTRTKQKTMDGARMSLKFTSLSLPTMKVLSRCYNQFLRSTISSQCCQVCLSSNHQVIQIKSPENHQIIIEILNPPQTIFFAPHCSLSNKFLVTK